MATNLKVLESRRGLHTKFYSFPLRSSAVPQRFKISCFKTRTAVLLGWDQMTRAAVLSFCNTQNIVI